MKLGKQTFNSKNQLIALLLIALGLNVNTLFHSYALDDFVVITDNKYVEKGINGIPEILTNDLMSGCTTKENLLSQPRYRPFTLIIFALEHQFFGKNPFVSHLLNVLFFAFLIGLLFHLLKAFLFRDQNEHLAFLTCLLFTVHPLHTEVIANVKSRDELLAFILLIISLITLLRYYEKRKLFLLLTGILFFFLALLTRESAVTFVAVVPLILYFFYNKSINKSIVFTFPLIVAFIAYLLIRFSVIGINKPMVTDVLNAPFLYASVSQAFATKVFILLKYLLLMAYPYRMSYDYSFNQIPYIEMFSFKFIISMFVLFFMILYALITLKNKSLLSFSIFYFMITISLVANFVVDIGTPFSERLLFQPSLSYCIAMSFLFLQLFKKAGSISFLLLFSVLIFFSVKTIARNRDWKNNETLFITDVNSSPNSARTNIDAAEVYRYKAENENNERQKMEYLQKAIFYCEKSLRINPDYSPTYISLGFAYFDQYNYDNASELFLKAYKLDTASVQAKYCMEVLSVIFYEQGNGLSENGNIEKAIRKYLKAIELNSGNVEAWYNLGGNYYLKKDTLNAMKAWDKVILLDPVHSLKKEDFINK